MSNLAPLPPGFVLMEPEEPASASEGMPPLPPGFELMPDESQTAASGGPSFIDGVVRAAGRGVLGIGSYLDEADAATNAALAPMLDPLLPDSFQKLPGATFGERYDQALGIQRGKDRQFDAEHPYVSTGAQLAGGIGSGLGVLRAAPAVGNFVLGNGGAGVGGKLAASVGSGLATGAVQGFGAGEGGIGNRTLGAGLGAGIGGGIGLAALPAGAVIGRGVNKIADILASRGAPVGHASHDLLNRTLANEGMTIEDAGRIAQKMGPTAMLADATEGLRYRTEQLAQADTPSRSGVINTLRDRSASAGERIGGAFDAALGERPNVYETVKGLSRQMKERADPLYEQARRENLPVDVSPVLKKIDDMMLTPAEKLAGRPDLPNDPVDTALLAVRRHLANDDVQNISVDRLDRLERRIRGRTDVAFKTGHSDEGHALSEIGKALRDQLKASSPVYKQARETYADDASVKSAFETGQAIFARKTHPDFLAAEVADMSEAEREALKVGVRSAVDSAVGSVRNGSLKGRQLLDSDFNERKILTVLGEEDGRRLINSLQGEQAMADTANQVLGGPATARRLDNPFRSDASAIPRVPQGFIHGGFTLAQKGLDALSAGSRNKLARDLGPVLTATGDKRDLIVQALIAQDERRGQSQVLDPQREALVNAILKVGSLAYGQSVLP